MVSAETHVAVPRVEATNCEMSANSILKDGLTGTGIRRHARYIEETITRWLSGIPDTHKNTESKMESGDFHERGGWYFARLEDGSVRIRVDGERMDFVHVIPPASWASIIAHVAAEGGSAGDFSKATDLHAGTPDTTQEEK